MSNTPKKIKKSSFYFSESALFKKILLLLQSFMTVKDT